MAKKISVEIGLEGGTEVERQLEDIGKTGQKALGDIQSAADQVNLDSATSQFDDLGNAGQAVFQKVQTAAQSATAFEQVVQSVKKVEGAFESLGTAVAKIGARMTRSLGVLGVAARALGPLGIALGVVGGAFIKFGDDSADALNKLNVEAAKLGQTPQQFDQLQKALAGLGVSVDAIGPGLTKFRETLGEDFTGNLTAEFGRFIAQLEQMPDGVQRTQLAIATLGDALGGQVIAGLQAGTLNAQNFQTALAGITPATQQQIVQAQQYQIALNQLNAAWAELKREFVPITTSIFGFLTEEIKNLKIDLRNMVLEYQFVKAVIETFTAPLDQQAAAAQRAAEAYKRLGTGAQEIAQTAPEAADGIRRVGDAVTQAEASGAGIRRVADDFRQIGNVAVQAGQQVAQTGQQATQAGQQITEGMNTANQALQSTATQADATSQAVQKVKAPESSSWTSWASTVVGALQSAINKLLEWIGLKDKAGAGGGGGGGGSSAPGKARGGLIGGRGSGTSDSNLAWVSRGEFVVRAAAVRKYGAGLFAALNAQRFADGGLVEGGGTTTVTLPIDQIVQAIEKNTEAIDSQSSVIIDLGQIISGLVQTVAGLAETVAGLAETVAGLVQTVAGLRQQQSQLAQSISGQTESGQTENDLIKGELRQQRKLLRDASQRLIRGASGGLLGGRGSGTSDSNLAWLSRGEFVMRAAAVRKFGAAFFAALNAGMIPGFALGGLVPRPAFAGGGSVGGMSHVTIQFPGVPPVSGLRASSAVVEELQRSAALAQVRSGGRKPSRYS
jgi:methyl-accepting chemotaxis protein